MLKKLFAATLALSLLVFATSCGDDGECTEHIDTNSDTLCDECGAAIQNPLPPVEEISEATLIENGVAKFNIVIARSASTAGANKAVDSLIKTLKSLGVTVEKVSDTADTLSDCEIIIGAPDSRGDAYKNDPHELGPEGYSIKLIDGRVQILAGSDAALTVAMKIFTEDFLGIKKATEELGTVKISEEANIEEKQTEFKVTSLKICGEDMKGFTIATDKSNSYTMKLAEYIQSKAYERAGYWFEIVPLAEKDRSIIIKIEENDGVSKGYSLDISDGEMEITCQFPEKLEPTFNTYFIKKLVNAAGEVEFLESETEETDVRRIYYEEFGATSNGTADDDFNAIKEAHKYANKWGHTVCATEGATYYIGNAHAVGAIVKTDTDWSAASFIIDDRSILPTRADGKYNWEKDTVLFSIEPKNSSTVYTLADGNLPITSVKSNAENIGFAPGFDAIVIIKDSTRKAYIRFGGNADDGETLTDVAKVDKYGNVYSETSLIWDFDNITEIEVIPTDDAPITVRGGFFTRYHNVGPSEYSYYSRNIVCTRSNTTITNIDYSIEAVEEEDGGHGCPYDGFISVQKCDGTVVKSCELEDPPTYSTVTATSGPDGIAMGSYYLSGYAATNVTWKDMQAKNFWNDAGNYIASGGGMGTNYCKNVFFLNNNLFTFDAHCGSGNITVKNCALRNVNAIGGGKIYIENTDFYCEKQRALIVLRQDYGSLWMGDVEIVDCEVFLPDGASQVGIFRASREPNHDFGYETCMPKNVTIDNLKVNSQTKTIGLVFGDSVIGAPLGANVINPYRPTEKVVIKNCKEENVVLDMHAHSDFFKNMVVEIQ